MNRFIIGGFGVLSLLAVLLAGCAVEQTERGAEDQSAETNDSNVILNGSQAVGSSQVAAPTTGKPEHALCMGCGPLPDPWKMGPLPDPWTSSSGGGSSGTTSSSSGGSSGSSGASSSGNGKP